MSEYSFTPAQPQLSGLVREPLGRQIATAVARDIISGRLQPGDAVSQEGLCTRFGTSRMPVRDALQELAAAGYLSRGPGNQLSVVSLGPEDVADILFLEASLTGLIARRAAERATTVEMDFLQGLHEQMCTASGRGDGVTMSALNHQFHAGIATMARAPRLVGALRATQIHVGWQYYIEQPDRMALGCKEHAEIVAAMRAGDSERAQLLMDQHVGDAQRFRVPAGPAGSQTGGEEELA